MASFMHVSYTLVFHQSKCISAMRRNCCHVYTLMFFHGIFVPKQTGSHVALCERSPGATSSRELFKGSKDSASILSLDSKEIFWLGVRISCECRHKWTTFRPPWPTSPGPGPKLLDGSISLKFLLETRLQSKPFDDPLGFRV